MIFTVFHPLSPRPKRFGDARTQTYTGARKCNFRARWVSKGGLPPLAESRGRASGRIPKGSALWAAPASAQQQSARLGGEVEAAAHDGARGVLAREAQGLGGVGAGDDVGTGLAREGG